MNSSFSSDFPQKNSEGEREILGLTHLLYDCAMEVWASRKVLKSIASSWRSLWLKLYSILKKPKNPPKLSRRIRALVGYREWRRCRTSNLCWRPAGGRRCKKLQYSLPFSESIMDSLVPAFFAGNRLLLKG